MTNSRDDRSSGTGGSLTIVEKWLAHSGYSLEFEIAHVLTQGGWQANMAVSLPGQDGRPRDVDILAELCIKGKGWSKLRKCVAYLLIECKHVPNERAWVLLGERQVREPRFSPRYVPSTIPDSRVKPVLFDPTKHHADRGVTVLSHGLVEASLSKKPEHDAPDPAYRSVSKVVDLAWSFVQRCRELDPEAKGADAVYVVPVVVIRGNLARVCYDPDKASMVPRIVTDGAMISSVPPETTRIEVLTNLAFADFLVRIKEDVTRWSTRQMRSAALKVGQQKASKYPRRKRPTRRARASAQSTLIVTPGVLTPRAHGVSPPAATKLA